MAVLLFLAGGTTFVLRERRVAKAAALAAASRAVRDVLLAVDRGFTLNDPPRFVASIHFRSAEEEQFRQVLIDYIRAESLFRGR